MKTFNLTFSQAKAIIDQLGRDELETFSEAMNDQPEFLQEMGEIDSVNELVSLYESGASCNAHWSVFYAQALECMSKYSESVESELEHLEPIPYDLENDTFSQFCSNLCAMAVENFVHKQSEFIEVLKNTDY